MKPISIPFPTTDEVTRAAKALPHEDFDAIRLLIDAWPDHQDSKKVLIKACAINQLYRTAILSVEPVAAVIVRHHAELTNCLQKGDGRAVDLIREVKFNAKTRDNYSFATKYCHLHEPSKYPIFDTRVERTLCALQKATEFCSKTDLKDIRVFGMFQVVLEKLRDYFSITCSIADLDKYLYLYGEKVDTK